MNAAMAVLGIVLVGPGLVHPPSRALALVVTAGA